MDHYGNAMTGLRASAVRRDGRLVMGGRRLGHARVYSETLPGEIFWYENSLGLVEVAANAASAAATLGLRVGTVVEFEQG